MATQLLFIPKILKKNVKIFAYVIFLLYLCSVHLQGLPAGFYTVVVNKNEERITKKIILQ